MIYNDRFPVLSTLAKILFILGILVLFLGVACGIIELFQLIKLVTTTGATWRWAPIDFILIGFFVFFVSGGLFIMAVAETIGVLFNIEHNTRSNK